MKLKVLDLFSGIGGFSLGLESTGFFETIGFVEKDNFCQKVLKKHWSNINIEGDIRNVKGERYAADVVTGGFPCQPFSVAGKRKSTADDRYLWDEMLRVIRETKPRWVIGENVEGIVNINEGMVLRQVLNDLENEGFKSQCIIIPASGIGAWHQRKRIWIIANANTRLSIRENEEIQTRGDTIINGSQDVSNSDSIRHRGWSSEGCTNTEWSFFQREQEGYKMGSKVKGCNGDVSNSKSFGRNGGEYGNNSKEEQIQFKIGRESSNGDVPNSNGKRSQRYKLQHNLETWEQISEHNGKTSFETQQTWWQTQSEFCGVPNGVSYELDKDRTNRIKSLGNSIVPHIVRQIGLSILTAEGII
jgi:DNA (cytosine-5)-methyltransferase 1